MKPNKDENFSVDKFFTLSEAEADKQIKKIIKERDKILAREDISKARKTVARRLLKVTLDCARLEKRVAHKRECGRA
jgi:hypothetical protein